jgi:hypothetical protein
MGTHHGNGGVVKVGANTVAEVKEWNTESGSDTAEDTSMGDAWKTHIAGQKEWSGSLSCHWDETDTNGQETLTEGASVTLNLYYEGAGTGAKYQTGTALITRITMGTSMDGIVSRAFQFLGTGALSWATAS